MAQRAACNLGDDRQWYRLRPADDSERQPMGRAKLYSDWRSAAMATIESERRNALEQIEEMQEWLKHLEQTEQLLYKA